MTPHLSQLRVFRWFLKMRFCRTVAPRTLFVATFAALALFVLSAHLRVVFHSGLGLNVCQSDEKHPWRSDCPNRFLRYEHLQSPLSAIVPIPSCAQAPSPQRNKECAAARKDRALKHTLASSFLRKGIVESTGARLIYLDLGARHPFPTKLTPKNSSLPFFARQYPWGGEINIYAFEADSMWAPLYTNIEDVRSRLPGVASLHFFNKAVGVQDRVAHLLWESGKEHASSTRVDIEAPNIHSESQSASDLLSNDGTKFTVDEIDFANWLGENIVSSDFVVCKMDIEGAEFAVIPHLISHGVMTLIDEIFLECHDDGGGGLGHSAKDKCSELHRSVRAAGVWDHEWP